MEIDLTIYLIARIREKANRFLTRELKSRGLGRLAPSHGDLMLALFQHRQLTMKALAELIDRDKSTVTALVGKLVVLGFVQKRTDPIDSRITLVSLTDEGASLKADFKDISRRLYEKIFRGVSDPERKALSTLLAKINENL
ncbi:MAG: MarR family transcriptional regulator [Desulfobacterales bacterium]|nr:MarR family transcriptional regulator [Desulfobacterales bacterium]